MFKIQKSTSNQNRLKGNNKLLASSLNVSIGSYKIVRMSQYLRKDKLKKIVSNLNIPMVEHLKK